MKHQFCVALALLFASFAVGAADSQTVAKVTYVGTYGNGRLFVGLDTSINEPGCPNPRFDVFPANPQIKNWLKIALEAVATGKYVVVQTNGCYGPFPTMTADGGTYFYLRSN